MHLVVVDADGKISGTKGTVLERHTFMSKALDAKTEDGSSSYYANVINKRSRYVRWTDHLISGNNWGTRAQDTATFAAPAKPYTVRLAGGRDTNDKVLNPGVDAGLIKGYDLFRNPELVDISLVMLGDAETNVVIHVINNICESRKDCIAFISPPRDAVIDNAGNEAVDTIVFRNSLPSTSYAVMDSGWKYQYDKYNDVFRWVPLNGDIAGLCVRTDVEQDPWWSPAGYNRGNIKNVIKLAYSPFKAQRDDLYQAGVNPVISQQGQGTVLFGDKTLLAKPSAFDRINVRRLFIVLEKAIARAARFMLFEFNDEFTRQQFRSLVEPFLRDVQSRRGIYDFRVVCDKTNNTGEVIDRNEFVGEIYIKPARSINFIQLKFVAVRSGVEFSEVVGRA
jgi:phage tail sheath protein FI